MTVSWAQALARRVPPLRNAYLLRRRPAIGPLAAVIDEWLLADWEVLRKQPPTAPAGVRQRLVAERGASVSEVTVSRHAVGRRAELGLADTLEAGAGQAQIGLAGSHGRPGGVGQLR